MDDAKQGGDGEPAPRRYTHVDLARGLCAFAVLILHYKTIYPATAPGPGPGLRDLPAWQILAPLYHFGGLAVPMFWIISGFVFMAVYGDGRTGARKFLLWRFSRLYPLHLATLLLMLALVLLAWRLLGRDPSGGANDARHFALQLVMASNWFDHMTSFNGPIWSVSAEIPVYAAFLLYARGFPGRTAPALPISLTCRAASFVTDVPVIACAAYFFEGVALFGLVRRLPQRGGMLFGCVWLIGAVGAAAAAFRYTHDDAAVLDLAYVLLPPAFILAALSDLFRPPVPARHRWIGDITYSTYLLHTPIMLAMAIVMALNGWRPNGWTLALFLALVLICARLCYRYFELPAQRWIRRAAGRRGWGHEPVASLHNAP